MEKLIKLSDAMDAVMWGNGLDGSVVDDICEKLEALPSADRQQGEWIRDMYWSRGAGMGEEYGFFYKCSLCEYEVENGYTRCSFSFCPHCGARMKGADDGTR